MIKIELKRAYESETPKDGFRVYVDRLWPRGLSHATFHYDLWAKEVAPSTELRHWLHEDLKDRWEEFKKKYVQELEVNPHVSKFWETIKNNNKVTFLYSSHDTERNNAEILQNYINLRFNK